MKGRFSPGLSTRTGSAATEAKAGQAEYFESKFTRMLAKRKGASWDTPAKMDEDTAKELAEALKGLKDAVKAGDTSKKLADFLKGLKDAVKAERTEQDSSFHLDQFIHKNTDPYVW